MRKMKIIDYGAAQTSDNTSGWVAHCDWKENK